MDVLVAATGEPRVRCESGSPLSIPVAVAAPTYVGVAWPGFDPAAVVEIEPCDEPLTQFVLQDTATGEPFVRPIGTDVTGDSDATLTVEGIVTTSTTIPTTATTATAATTTSTTTTTLPVANHDATGEGTVTASSRLCGSYAAAKSVDGDVTTRGSRRAATERSRRSSGLEPKTISSARWRSSPTRIMQRFVAARITASPP